MYLILSLIILPKAYKNSFPNDSENVFLCSNVQSFAIQF